jgi:hypothetical protein
MAEAADNYYAKVLHFADGVTHLSTMTLIHRSISPAPPQQPSELSSICIDYARRALDSHQRCYNQYKETEMAIWEAYLNWYVLTVIRIFLDDATNSTY